MVNYSMQILDGDTHTPISIFLKLQGEKKFLLESSLKHEKSGRYSFIGMNPFYELIAYGDEITCTDLYTKQTTREIGDPLEILNDCLLPHLKSPVEAPFFAGGIGYVGYDVIKQYEHIEKHLNDDIAMPDIHFQFYEQVVVYDHLLQQVTVIVFDRWLSEEKVNRDEQLNKLVNQIEHGDVTANEGYTISQFHSNYDEQSFEQMVSQVKEHIDRGDIYQAVISQRLTANFAGSPFAYYRKLRKSNPSPYMYFIDFSNYAVLGTSPESLVKVKGDTVTTNPIAGTRKRGATVEEDHLLEKELLNDDKEIAEHMMLVDLGRGDLGKVCKPGTIHLSKHMLIEKYRYVMHIVSEVTGELKPTKTSTDALKACLPAGTVSGAPKKRAIELINELEKCKRGVYSGAIGYISINGNLDFALAIRTMVIKDGKAHVQAGAGIVHDSIPKNEFAETMNKARALLEVH